MSIRHESERMTSQAGSDPPVAAPPVPGIRLLRTLRGHGTRIGQIAWSPDGSQIASVSHAGTLRLWDARYGELSHRCPGEQTLRCLAFDPTGRTIALSGTMGGVYLWTSKGEKTEMDFEDSQGSVSALTFDRTGEFLAGGTRRGTIKVWQAATGRLAGSLKSHSTSVYGLAACDDLLVSGDYDNKIALWDWRKRRPLELYNWGANGGVLCLASSSAGDTVATGNVDRTVRIWKPRTATIRTLEGHTQPTFGVSFSGDGRLVASKSDDDTVRIWRAETGACLATIPAPTANHWWAQGTAFHPTLPLLATVSSADLTWEDSDNIIHVWELDLGVLLREPAQPTTAHYVNAKVVLVGDTGVGKSGLSLVLNGQEFEPTESTAGRRVWTLSSEEVETDHRRQTRETLLWDLAGQPGYRVIHQLHLGEVAVALLVFDARSETDPLAGVRHWERALRLAQQRQGPASVPMKKFLVSARVDRGTVSVSKERLAALLEEHGMDGYFETSAKEGRGVAELREAIGQAIEWNALPEVSSSLVFGEIKAWLLATKRAGLLIAQSSQLRDEFVRLNPDLARREPLLRQQLDTCIGRLENRDLIRRLSFGDYVLLQSELLDAYASAIVNAAKEEPDGLGSIAEDIVLAGRFFVPDDQRIRDRGQEQLILHATVEELVRHELALREGSADGRHLVFPSQFNRDYEDAPEPKGKALAITFDGPVQSLYSTLTVRLGHSGLFSTGRWEMWRNAAVFTAKVGGRCGLYLHEFAEGRGRLVMFYDRHDGMSPTDETRFHFEEFVLAHCRQRALHDSLDIVRFFVCSGCGEPVPDAYVKRLRGKGVSGFDCPCGSRVSLAEPSDRLRFTSRVEAMERAADGRRNFEAFVESARGETRTPSFSEWAEDERVTLAIVFTDIVASTALTEALKDEGMNEVRRAHFAQSRALIDRFKGREIKTIGDSFMAAFKSVEKALDYARALQAQPGHPEVKVRAGIHIGAMHVEENDVFGGTVNFAARVVGAINGAEIWISDRAKQDLASGGARQHRRLSWERHQVEMKGFPGTFVLWSLRSSAMNTDSTT